MNIKSKNIIVNFTKALINEKISFFVALLLRTAIKERRHDGRDRRWYTSGEGKVTILALDSQRYRGDLDAFASHKEYRVLHISQGWQRLLIAQYFDKEVPVVDIINSTKGDHLYNLNLSALSLLRSVLKHLYKIIKVDIVTTVNYHYLPDYSWTLASQELGVPWIMLYRECNLGAERFLYGIAHRHTQHRKFKGSHIIVHNKICKEVFTSSGYALKEQVSVCGALRMDSYLKRLNTYKESSNRRKKFTLFYFPHNMTLFGRIGEPPHEKFRYAYNIWEGRENLFRDLHLSIIKLAHDNPDVDFVIKPKDIMVNTPAWEFYKTIVSESDIDIHRLSNYSVQPNADVHSLILSSDVICGLQSSTILESGIAGKRIIFPLFNNYMHTDNFNDFLYKDNVDLFDIAHDKNEFEQLFKDCIINNSVSSECMHQRNNLFNIFFDSHKGDSLLRYDRVIRTVIEQNNTKEKKLH